MQVNDRFIAKVLRGLEEMRRVHSAQGAGQIHMAAAALGTSLGQGRGPGDHDDPLAYAVCAVYCSRNGIEEADVDARIQIPMQDRDMELALMDESFTRWMQVAFRHIAEERGHTTLQALATAYFHHQWHSRIAAGRRPRDIEMVLWVNKQVRDALRRTNAHNLVTLMLMDRASGAWQVAEFTRGVLGEQSANRLGALHVRLLDGHRPIHVNLARELGRSEDDTNAKAEIEAWLRSNTEEDSFCIAVVTLCELLWCRQNPTSAPPRSQWNSFIMSRLEDCGLVARE